MGRHQNGQLSISLLMLPETRPLGALFSHRARPQPLGLDLGSGRRVPVHLQSQKTKISWGHLALGLARLLVQALGLVRSRLKHPHQHLRRLLALRKLRRRVWHQPHHLRLARPRVIRSGSRTRRQRHRARLHSAGQHIRSHSALLRLRSLLSLRLRLGVASLYRRPPLLAGFHSPPAVRSRSVSQVVQHQLQPQIHLLLLLPPPNPPGVLYLPLVLRLSLMGDRSRSFLVVELGDADRFQHLFLLVIAGFITDKNERSSHFRFISSPLRLCYLTITPPNPI